MIILKIIELCIIVFVFLTGLWLLRKYRQNKLFKKNMKEGDKCFFYDGEIRSYGVIIKIKNNIVTMKNDLGEYLNVDKDELYV
jgi:hypothetical protein